MPSGLYLRNRRNETTPGCKIVHYQDTDNGLIADGLLLVGVQDLPDGLRVLNELRQGKRPIRDSLCRCL